MIQEEWGNPLFQLCYGFYGSHMPRKEEIIGKITELVEDYIKGRDLEVYMVGYRKTGPDWKLKVILDKPADSPDEYVNITECEDVARFLGDSLDQLDIIDNKYILEVESPGMDRELLKDEDFTRFAGREVEVKLYKALDGIKQFDGILKGLEDGKIIIETDDGQKAFSRQEVSKINLAVVF